MSGGPAAAVVYRSEGRVLFIGSTAALAPWLARPAWPAPLRPAFLATDDGPVPQDARVCRGRPVRIEGHLGTFRVPLADGREAAAELLGPAAAFDLVVDTGEPPLLKQAVLPFGYFAPGPGRDLDALVAALPDWVGEFDKPRYFTYRDERCARRGGGRDGCRRCVDACPAAAIALRPTGIAVDPYLCQGCGDCVTACPTGALGYRWPPPEEFLARGLDALASRPGAPVAIVAEARRPDLTADWLVLPVHSVAAWGPDAWLTLLLGGAAAVFLQREGLVPSQVDGMAAQFGWVRAWLAALGYPPERIGWLETAAPVPPQPLTPAPVRLAPLADRHDRLVLALDRLAETAPRRPAEVPLPAPAPLGGVDVDGDCCTLCHACVAVCPTGALQAGGERPRLGFVEENCVQCAQCVRQCPERAITLRPRWLADAGARRRPRWLHQDEVLRCLDCGRPFGSRRLVEAVAARIAGHPLFADPVRRRRLYLCEDCRIRDLARG